MTIKILGENCSVGSEVELYTGINVYDRYILDILDDPRDKRIKHNNTVKGYIAELFDNSSYYRTESPLVIGWNEAPNQFGRNGILTIRDNTKYNGYKFIYYKKLRISAIHKVISLNKEITSPNLKCNNCLLIAPHCGKTIDKIICPYCSAENLIKDLSL